MTLPRAGRAPSPAQEVAPDAPQRPSRPGRAGAARGGAARAGPARAEAGRDGDEGGEAIARAHRQVQHLHEVSKILLRFESPWQTISSVFAAMTGALALRNAVLLYDEGGLLACHFWQADGATLLEVRLAEARARHWYAYLAGEQAAPNAPSPARARAAAGLLARAAEARGARDEMGGAEARGARDEMGGAGGTVTLPLIAIGGRVFGVLQFVVGERLDEAGLFFASSVVGQLAIALERHAMSGAERASARRREPERGVAPPGLLARPAPRGAPVEGRGGCDTELAFSRAVTDSLGEGVVAVDGGARVTFFNPAAERLLGWGRGEAMGALVPGLLRVQAAGGAMLRPEECPLLQVLHTGETLRGDEIMFLGRDDVPFPVGYTAAPIRHEGRVAGAVLVFQNVTALKRSENAQHFLSEVSAALAGSLDPEQTLAAVARLAVPFLADACRVEELAESGAAARVALADGEGEAGGAGRFELDPRWAGARAGVTKTGRALLWADLAGSAPGRGGAGAGRPGGPPLASLMVVPMRARGRPVGLLTLGSLGSGRRYGTADLAFAGELAHRAAVALDNAHSYEAARRAAKQRQDVLAVVSHDLRNPLGVVLLGATFLAEQCEKGDSEQARKMLDLVTRSIAKMDRLLKDLLDTSSIEAGRLSLNRRPYALGELVEGALGALRPLAAQKSLRLATAAPGEGPLLTCDWGRFVQALSNLVGNAIKFTPEGGAITVGAEWRAADVRVSVADTGPGIAPGRLPHVFERPWQAKETAAKVTGLGLFLCKGIVEAHGGAMGVESEVGRGSTFFFTLPLVPPAELDVDASAALAAAEEPGRRSSERSAPPSLVWPSAKPTPR